MFKDGMSIGALVIGFCLVIGIGSIALAPLGIISKTVNPDNVITSYEWFHDVNGNVQARVGQIKSFKNLVSKTNDNSELSRLNVELNAIQQSCRDMTTKYNAQSGKVNKMIFKNGVPERLEPSICE